MYIPLDNLYHWISSLTPSPACIYYFYPHGSRILSDVTAYPDFSEHLQRTNADRFPVFCHDQEPLNFAHFDKMTWDSFRHESKTEQFKNTVERFHYNHVEERNLNLVCHGLKSYIFDKTILVHSEKNSVDVELYRQNDYVPVHYWCHGIIARDWFRFAQVDPRLLNKTEPAYDFLIYSRDWSGSREYRLCFLGLLADNRLTSHSLCYFNSVSPSNNYHYTEHKFQNVKFYRKLLDTENFISSRVDSSASATYDTNDHTNTAISVVLETQFDDDKIHLTEKICRSLACAHPFILAAGPGSLRYLKTYGFETFEPWLDESYDQEVDSGARLEKITNSMKQFANLPKTKKSKTLSALRTIALRNQQRFFSEDFGRQLQNELRLGLMSAFDEASDTMARRWLSRRRIYKLQCRELGTNDRFCRLENLLQIIRASRLKKYKS